MTETETKFTPGPWRLHNGTVHASRPRERYHVQYNRIASVSLARKDSSEFFANAHLIAAAPDMYEALESLHAEIGKLPADLGNHALVGSVFEAAAALSKARGE